MPGIIQQQGTTLDASPNPVDIAQISQAGSPVSGTNPFPVTLTATGPIVIGTVNQGSPNTVANGWPVYLEVGGAALTATTNMGQLSLNTNITGGVVSGTFSQTGLSIGLKSQSVMITDTATAIPLPVNSLANRNGITIRVKGNNTVYFGDSSVTAAQGYYKYRDEEMQLDIKNNASVIIYGICDTGLSSEIRIMEVA